MVDTCTRDCICSKDSCETGLGALGMAAIMELTMELMMVCDGWIREMVHFVPKMMMAMALGSNMALVMVLLRIRMMVHVDVNVMVS